MYEPRTYREWVKRAGLASFTVSVGESDLLIRARKDLSAQAEAALRHVRAEIESEIARVPEFETSLTPLPCPLGEPPGGTAKQRLAVGAPVRWMYEAAERCGVGPMAAVAGAVAQVVGEALLEDSPEIIVENGGDIYARLDRPIEVGLFAGERSPFTGKLRLRIDGSGRPLGICTSSGTVGHSLSFGKADAVVAVAPDATLADAAATAICNRVKTPQDVAAVLESDKEHALLDGLLICLENKIGAWGNVKLAQ